MHWGKKEGVTFGSECTPMLIIRSCCIDCQGSFHGLRPKELRHTLRFFWRSECKLIEKFFGILKIFVIWHAKHEASYIVNMKTYETNVDWDG